MSDETSFDEDDEPSDVRDLLAQVASAPRTAPLEGETLGRYEIGSRLGEGGMGVVFEAHDQLLGRKVAVKVLRQGAEVDHTRRDRMLREARAASKVSHPNVAVVHDVAELGGRMLIAMELLRGETLRATLRDRERLGEAEAMALVTSLTRGVAAAHDAGVTHRDLKPENIFVTDDGTVKVLDFGVAKMTGATLPDDPLQAPAEAMASLLAGTPAYMAPEQARGDAVTPAADVYSIGLILAELVSGQRPREDRPVDTSALPRNVARIVRVCLEPDPDLRPRTAAELLRLMVPKPASSRWRIDVLVAVGGIALMAASAFVSARSRPSPLLPAAPAEDPARPMKIVDHPPPETAVPAAAVAYTIGLQQLRDSQLASAGDSFAEAVRLDPSMAPAHLRLALLGLTGVGAPGEPLKRAYALRDRLPPRDRLLLDAWEPMLLRPSVDLAASAAAFDVALSRYPDDAEILAWAGFRGAAPAEADLIRLERALAIDPAFGEAWRRYGMMLFFLGREPEARAAWSRCVEIEPSAIGCIASLVDLDLHDGRCAEAVQGTRRVVSREPTDAHGVGRLAVALLATGKEPEAISAIEQEAVLVGRDRQGPRRMRRVAALAVLRGDFAEAERIALAHQELVREETTSSAHFSPALTLVELALERGDEQAAGALAREFIARRSIWADVPGFPPSEGLDPTPFMANVAHRAGRLSRAALDERIAWWLARGGAPFTKWAQAIAMPAQTAEEAADALARAPARLSGSIIPRGIPDADIGRLYLLDGRVAESVPFLRRGAKSCLALLEPFAHTRAHYHLGRALELSGDVPGACAAYGVVVERWGGATPASRSAMAATERSNALECSPKKK